MRGKRTRIEIGQFDQLIPLFAADRAIELAFLFGSHARGEAGPLSDVDIALLIAADVPRDRYLDCQLNYSTVIAEMLHDDRVEIIILNTAPAALAHQVIQGRVLYERTAEARVEFIVAVQRKYLDLKPFYAIDHLYMHQRLEERRYGQP